MKPLVNALDRPHPTDMKSAGDRHPRRTVPHFKQIPQCASMRTVHDPRGAGDAAYDALNHAPAVSRADIDAVQLERLAQALLSKNHHDLTALAQSNPALIKEWKQAFQHQKQAAERSARYWASASAVLATTHGLNATRCKNKSTH